MWLKLRRENTTDKKGLLSGTERKECKSGRTVNESNHRRKVPPSYFRTVYWNLGPTSTDKRAA